MDGAGFGQRRGWLLVLFLILVGQGWLTLRLFDDSFSLNKLVNDEFLVSGKHPLHLYHGYLGAKTWLERGTGSCYDPAFQAGYPKTPVFDSGSRPAELFLLLGGGNELYAYKIGIVLCCLLVPIAFAAMGRGVYLPPGSCCLSALFGSVLWWSPPIRSLIEAGDIDLLLGGLCVLVHLAWWVRFSHEPWLDSWLVLTITSTLAWFTQPSIMVCFIPLVLLFYFWVAYQHGVAWHLSVFALLAISFIVNFPWLSDWARYVLPLLSANEGTSIAIIPWKQLLIDWQQLFPRDPLSIGIGLLGIGGTIGLVRQQGLPASILLLCTIMFIAVGGVSRCWQPLMEIGGQKVLVLAVWGLVPSCAFVFGFLTSQFGKSLGHPMLGVVWLLFALAGLAWSMELPHQWTQFASLPMGLNTDREELVHLLNSPPKKKDLNSPVARILWEDRNEAFPGSNWTALLPLYTHRQFLGGLDPTCRLEHMTLRLVDGKLRGRSIQDWSDEELKQFCSRYNIGWIVCWSQESIERFKNFSLARPVSGVKDHHSGMLFELERPSVYFLKGRGQIVQLDWQRIALAEVTPAEDGEVILSMHYQSDWRISPPYVEMEKAIIDPFDPIPLMRFKLPGPVARLTLVWENR